MVGNPMTDYVHNTTIPHFCPANSKLLPLQRQLSKILWQIPPRRSQFYTCVLSSQFFPAATPTTKIATLTVPVLFFYSVTSCRGEPSRATWNFPPNPSTTPSRAPLLESALSRLCPVSTGTRVQRTMDYYSVRQARNSFPTPLLSPLMKNVKCVRRNGTIQVT